MADRPAITSQPVPRADLSRTMRDPRVLRAFEALFHDAQVVIPDAIELTNETVDSLTAAINALTAALDALQTAPPPAPEVLPEIPDDQTVAICSLRDRVATLERAVSQLQEGPP